MSLKVAIAGAGYIAHVHAKSLLTNHLQPDALVQRNSQSGRAFAEHYQIPRQYELVEQMLAKGSVDALVIATPNFLHAPQAIAALEAGVHVLVEKPMAMNAAEAEAMAAAAHKSGAQLMVAHCWRFDREVLWLRSQVARLGKIIRTKGYGVHANWGPTGWFTQPELAGGGALADMGIHAFDTVRFLIGDPQPTRIYARIGVYYTEHDVDDTGVILIEWENGVVSYIESGWWQPFVDGPEAATQLYGVQGFGSVFPTRLLLSNPDKSKVELLDSGYIFPRPDHAPQAMYDEQIAYFINCIHTGETPIPGAAEGIVNIRLVDAAYESARTGQWVQLD